MWMVGRVFMTCRHIVSIVPLVVFVMNMASYAQESPQLETIPQRLARVGESLTSRPSTPSGVADMADVLKQTELIVRGTIGPPTKAYLSKDQRAIYTDYPLVKPVVLYDSRPRSSSTPGLAPAITVSILGGSVEIGGLTYTVIPEALP